MTSVKDTEKLLKDIKIGKHTTLKKQDVFKFDCTACGKCCFNNAVIINCYDIIRLRHRLKATTTEILQNNLIVFNVGPFSGFPVCTLNFQVLSNKFNKCPFLLPAIKKGKINPKSKLKMLCSVHKDRPLACRFFPCGRAKSIDKSTGKIKETFFLQELGEFCPGLKEEKEQTLEQYLNESEFQHYDEGSAKFASLIKKMIKSGFFIPTKKNDKDRAVLKEDSKIFLYLFNIMYNFDSFNYFSKDERVLSTITNPKATQKDFMYVVDKIETLIFHLIKLHKKHGGDDDAVINLINNFSTKGGE